MGQGYSLASRDGKGSHFRYFRTTTEIIRLAVALYVHFPTVAANVEDLLLELVVEVRDETARY